MTAKKTSAYHHGNLRATLIGSALKALATQRAEDLSLRELAKAAGVSIAAVYRHFPSKEALLAQLAVDGFESLMRRWQRRLPKPEAASAEERFRRLGEHYIEFAFASPEHYRLMFLHGDLRKFPALQEVAARCFGIVLGCAAAAVREAGAAEKWALPTANAAWALVHGYVMLGLGGRLTRTKNRLDLKPAMLSRYLQLPKEAFEEPR